MLIDYLKLRVMHKTSGPDYNCKCGSQFTCIFHDPINGYLASKNLIFAEI